MNIELIKKILINNSISEKELNTFISEYTYQQLNKHITALELSGILQAITMGMFDLRYAAIQAALSLNLNVLAVKSKEGHLLKTLVY